LRDVFGDEFELVETRLEQHRTPAGAEQQFLLVTADLTASVAEQNQSRGASGDLMAPILPPGRDQRVM
jgi:hypothetical protein